MPLLFSWCRGSGVERFSPTSAVIYIHIAKTTNAYAFERFSRAVILTKKEEAKASSFLLVPVVGVEPTRYRYHWILSPARLPIPSHRLNDFIIISHKK